MKKNAVEDTLTITHDACLVDGSDAEFRRLVNGLLPFAARLLSLRDGFGSVAGLTGIQYSLMRSISHLSKTYDVTVNQLADHLHLSGAFVTVETNKLKKLGLISKGAHPDDGRKIRLGITTAGNRLLAELLPIQRRINDVMFEGITRSEFRTLCTAIDRLVHNGDRAALDLEHLIARQQTSETKGH
jgi:DNA-binding MarR family transcriptional regulator